MIFLDTCELVLAGAKTQTRRLCRPTSDFQQLRNGKICDVIRNGRLLWRVGRSYAVQPGRGKPELGRIEITGIRAERLLHITGGDCQAEGLTKRDYLAGQWAEADLRRQFAMLWNGFHVIESERWVANPPVWVLTFALIDASGKESAA